MLKLEKIIILFSLLYSIKSLNLNNGNFNSNFKNRKSSCVANANSVRIKIFNNLLSIRFADFFITSVHVIIRNVVFKNKLYFCFKLQFRTIIVSIYFKKTLLFNVFRSLKKKVRTRKRIERLYKRKGLIYGVKKIVR